MTAMMFGSLKTTIGTRRSAKANRLFLVLFMLSGAATAGCDELESFEQAPFDQMNPDARTFETQSDHSPDPDACETLQPGDLFLFKSLTIDAPADPALQQLLNEVWSEEIASGNLITLYRIDALDAQTQSLTLAVGNGAPVLPQYRFQSAPNIVEATLQSCLFSTTEPSRLVMTPASVNRPIPFEHLVTSGRFSAGGSEIDDGRLAGYLSQSEADVLEFEVKGLGALNLGELLQAGHVEPDADLDNDGKPDAFLLAGAFTASRIAAE